MPAQLYAIFSSSETEDVTVATEYRHVDRHCCPSVRASRGEAFTISGPLGHLAFSLWQGKQWTNVKGASLFKQMIQTYSLLIGFPCLNCGSFLKVHAVIKVLFRDITTVFKTVCFGDCVFVVITIIPSHRLNRLSN